MLDLVDLSNLNCIVLVIYLAATCDSKADFNSALLLM